MVLAQGEILNHIPFGKKQETTVQAGRALTESILSKARI